MSPSPLAPRGSSGTRLQCFARCAALQTDRGVPAVRKRDRPSSPPAVEPPVVFLQTSLWAFISGSTSRLPVHGPGPSRMTRAHCSYTRNARTTLRAPQRRAVLSLSTMRACVRSGAPASPPASPDTPRVFARAARRVTRVQRRSTSIRRATV